jgi:hypothetical protein
MKQLDLENFECNMRLAARAKDNQDNYTLFTFEKIIKYYNLFKKEFNQKTNSSRNKKNE